MPLSAGAVTTMAANSFNILPSLPCAPPCPLQLPVLVGLPLHVPVCPRHPHHQPQLLRLHDGALHRAAGIPQAGEGTNWGSVTLDSRDSLSRCTLSPIRLVFRLQNHALG